MANTGRKSPGIALVVPCYNEAERLPADAYVAFALAQPELRLVFVDDGSTDATRERLYRIREAVGPRVSVVECEHNRGKAEAVRAGMLRAFELDCELCGYWDADLATPLEELPRFVAVLRDSPELLVVFGARVQLLGRSIERSQLRHYLGRVFATTVSNLLELPIYDTQCGAKVFRVTEVTRALFAEPFDVGWTFDVELIARLIARQRASGGRPARELIYELPLDRWHDVRGSKVGPLDFVRALGEVMRIRRRYLGRGD